MKKDASSSTLKEQVGSLPTTKDLGALHRNDQDPTFREIYLLERTLLSAQQALDFQYLFGNGTHGYERTIARHGVFYRGCEHSLEVLRDGSVVV